MIPLVKWAAAITVAGVLVACGPDAPKQGVVTNKRYKPAHDETYYSNMCVSRDKSGSCTISVPIPNHEHYDERWQLNLKDCHTKDNGKQECNEGWLDVDRGTYDSFQVGQRYPNPK